MKQWRKEQSKKKPEKVTPEYQPISLEYFLDMEVANGGPSKQMLNLNGKLKTVREIVEYWKQDKPHLEIDKNQSTKILQYYNCMMAEFRHDVANHHDIGWDALTPEYYESKKPMTDEEIEKYLKKNLSEYTNGFIKHSYHRAYAMIGRLIKGKPYIPFYMKTSQIYSEPRPVDGKHRVKPLTEKIKLLKKLDELGIDRNEYCLAQSSILAVMGIRQNDDLDIIISSKLRKQNIKWPSGVEVFVANRGKFQYFGAKGDDDLLENYCIKIDGYKFLEPRFYFARKFLDKSSRDISDWVEIEKWFNKGNHKGYPFNFETYKWGLPLFTTPNIPLTSIDFDGLEVIRDKYNRVVDEINQGRVIYRDPKNKTYIKIFHPEYCRLGNFVDALSSGVLNGLVPALKGIIWEKGRMVGYICEEGEVLSPNEFDTHLIPQHFITTVVRNCKQRGRIFYDLVPSNILRTKDGLLSLIDLESVYPLGDNGTMKMHKAQVKPSNLPQLIAQI